MSPFRGAPFYTVRLVVQYHGDVVCSWSEPTRDLMIARVASLLAIDPTLHLAPIADDVIELRENESRAVPEALRILMLRARKP